MLRKYQGLLTDYYAYDTNLLRLCYGIIAGSDTVKPRLHYGVNGILRLCNGSATVSTVMTQFGRLNVYFTQQSNCPSFLFYDINKDAARGEATGGRRRFAFDCALQHRISVLAAFNCMMNPMMVGAHPQTTDSGDHQTCSVSRSRILGCRQHINGCTAHAW